MVQVHTITQLVLLPNHHLKKVTEDYTHHYKNSCFFSLVNIHFPM